jgi:hypothetical protein
MLKRYHITTFEAEIEPGIRQAVYNILPDLTGYINDTLPEGRTGGAR